MSHDKTEFEQASEDLADINELLASKAFSRYYLRRLDVKIDVLKNNILHNSTKKGEDLEALRNQLWALEELRKMPEQEKVQCLRIAEKL